jgi:hypothetical protein
MYLYVSPYLFLKNGTFGNWSPYLYWETGHQTILTDWLFEEHVKKVGLQFVGKHFCAPFEYSFGSWFKNFVYKILFRLVCAFSTKIPPEARISEVVLFQVGNKPSSSEGAD